MEIVSVFTVTDSRTKQEFEESVRGDGQEAIKYLRGEYPPFSRFILQGFEIDGTFKPWKIW